MGRLAQVLRLVPPSTDPRVLVDIRTSDDAGVFRLTDDIALVQTVDFFTPVVDDPYLWGAISAANSLSDVYAMGGTPVTALNVAAFPPGLMDADTLGRVLLGAADKCREAGVAVLGGHTVEDAQPKFGLSVTGVVHPDRVVTNAGAREGDVLVLTKPLGTGFLVSAVKKGLLPADGYDRVVASMGTLNRAASEAMMAVGVDAATDVTGYGLLGHLWEMCLGAGLGAEVVVERLPVLPHVEAMRALGAGTRGPRQLYEHLGCHVDLPSDLEPWLRDLIADPQTSGGLLIAVAPGRAEALLAALHERGVDDAVAIGRMVGGDRIRVVGASA